MNQNDVRPLDPTTLRRADGARVPADPPRAENDPDAANLEQDEGGTQAQDVAGDALARASASDGASLLDHDPIEETVRGGPSDPAQLVPQDMPDLVETLHGMHASGRIDMGAFEGEEGMDEEDGYAGEPTLVDGADGALELTDTLSLTSEAGDVPADELDALDLDDDDQADLDDDGRVDRD